MGYTQSASDCANKKSIRCPFDTTAYLCLELGSCDFSDYPLTECPTGGNCSNITCDGTTKHKLNSCNSGYTMSGNTCTVNCDFSGYPLTQCPTGGNCTPKTCGGTTKYKLNSCKSGYNKSGNTCVYDPCYYAEDLDCDYGCAYYDYECGVCEECEVPDCDSMCISSSCDYPAGYNDYCECYTECNDAYCSGVCVDSSCGSVGAWNSTCNCGERCCDDFWEVFSCDALNAGLIDRQEYRDCYFDNGSIFGAGLGCDIEI